MKRRQPRAASCSPEGPGAAEAAALTDPQADAELAKLAKAVSHPVRVRILRILARKQAHMCCRIVDELPLAQSTVSEHLRILRAAGLIKVNEKGPQVGYCIVPSALERFKALIKGV